MPTTPDAQREAHGETVARIGAKNSRAGNGSSFAVGTGGGGGSGWNVTDGGLIAASGPTAANTTDPDYAADSGIAMGTPLNGGVGQVVVRLPKP